MFQAMQRGLARKGRLCAGLLTLFLAACGHLDGWRDTPLPPEAARPASPEGREVVLYALSLIGTDYRFGGKNPEAGLDCSGMVRYIYEQAAHRQVHGSAADIARQGRDIRLSELRPGDLVFFNTLNRPYSHVGIYIGEQRFIHAPSRNGQVRIDRLDSGYFASRLEAARSYFE
jgi:cell wall-associated NlpC family hydrolase